MRRVVVISTILLVAFGPGTTRAWAVTMHPGIKAGLNVANLGGDFADLGPKARIGTATGLSGILDFDSPVSVELGLGFAQRGAKLESEGTDSAGNFTGTYATTFELDYLEIPTLVRVELLRGHALSPYLFGGPVFAFNVRARLTENQYGFDTDIKDRIANVDVSLGGGAGLELSRGAWRYGVEGRYVTGMTDVFDSPGGFSTHHSVFTLLLSLMH